MTCNSEVHHLCSMPISTTYHLFVIFEIWVSRLGILRTKGTQQIKRLRLNIVLLYYKSTCDIRHYFKLMCNTVSSFYIRINKYPYKDSRRGSLIWVGGQYLVAGLPVEWQEYQEKSDVMFQNQLIIGVSKHTVLNKIQHKQTSSTIKHGWKDCPCCIPWQVL